MKIEYKTHFFALCAAVSLCLATSGVRAEEAPKILSGAGSSVVCKLSPSAADRAQRKKSLVICDYRHDVSFRPRQITLEVAGKDISVNRDSVRKYPNEGERTVLLAVFDVSDPRRSKTTNELYPKIVDQLIENRPNHVVIGLATFAQSVSVFYPFQAPTSDSRPENMPFSAVGASTELNRSVSLALEKLTDERAERRVLVVVSDGKAEDTAYRLEDVVAQAKRLNVPIVTLGVAERPSESPALQSLRVMADKTGGVFIDLSDKNVPVDLQARILSLVDVGGRVAFDGSAYQGKQTVMINLIDAGRETIKVRTDFEFPDLRETPEKVIDFLVAYWWALVSGALVVAGGIWGFIRYRRLRREREIENRPVAEFRGLDGDETRYEVRRAAVTLGRAAENDIVMPNLSVSGRHAELHRTREGLFRLSDLGSTNGTMVNGVRVTAIDVHDGDIVELAEVRLQFKVFD
jgi:hypothetical protein